MSTAASVRSATTRSPAEILGMFREYAACAAPDGACRDRLDAWAPIRATARRNWESLLEADRFAQDISEAALWKTLPHEDGPPAQQHGAFVHPLAPAVRGDVRVALADAGLVRPEQWVDLGRGLFELVRRCTEHPSELWQAVEAFLVIPGSQAFTSELVSPILHALRPSEFLLVDAPARMVLNQATGSAFSGSLRDFPAAHVAARRLLADLLPVLSESALCDRRPEDVLEGFCHWLVHVRLMPGSEPVEPTAQAQLQLVVTVPPAPQAADTPVEPPVVASAAPSPVVPPAPAASVPPAAVCEPSQPPPVRPASAPAPALPEHATAGPVPPPPAQVVPAAERTVERAAERAAVRAASRAAARQARAHPAPSAPPPPAPSPARGLADAKRADEPELPTLFLSPKRPPAAGSVEPAARVEPAAPRAFSAPPVVPAEPSLVSQARAALVRRGQLVLTGPPGSGKSHLALRLAQELVAQGDGLLEHLVFHGAWRYGDFVQAVRPDGSRLAGRFTTFCRQATARRGPCVLLVDDAERAELADVFGEALSLLDMRGREVSLAGGGSLVVPANVRLIFTLDGGSRPGRAALVQLLRSCAVLRIEGDGDELRRQHPGASFVDALLDLRRAIDAEIGDPDRRLPLAFFLRASLPAELPDVWRTEVEPFLQDALAGEPTRAAAFRWDAVAGRLGLREG